ncbi:amidohydrolase [Bacillus mojavensis]|uniref:amidohydrolase n=1 Tax=Bacillus mojavensis TaxID=72360 RepID=UPI002DBCE978|nr:amidohydrolase [Bacillus mojavensis]MEC1615555.1 amidohydrolase [Bacillus mojavensis]MEC1634340.1 amidohydrolase [Bacillus mojavensis]MEC1691218.1 amidohydrolase [Bacillus mojavensis]MEC1734782.1 amidohydrolase [Bacillus mojavensis]MED1007997.1 amidohydrolase [Bacillus mojavensis]
MDIIQIRRDLHRHPELGFTEFRTAGKVVETLQALGYHVTYGKDAMDGEARRGVPSEKELERAFDRAIENGADPGTIAPMKGGYTAVIGTLEGNAPGPVVALRFDMDALPITESANADHVPHAKGFRSEFEGTMHACAHDGHTAIGLGVAEALAHRTFAGTLKLIFQPAEEGVRGAYAVTEKGMLDDVDYLLCHHLGTNVPLGEIYGGAEGFLATTKMAVRFRGVSSHAGAAPEHGRNALLGAATALLNIHAIPRFSSGDTRINVGVLEGGTAANIIPQHAKMIIETRSDSEEVNRDLEERVRKIITHSAAMHELEHEVEIIGGAIPIKCDEEVVSTVLEAAGEVGGFSSLQGIQTGSRGSEDASYMIKRVQERGGKGTYMIIGTDIAAPHHHEKFDIQEDILPRSVQLLKQAALKLLK